MSLSGLHFRDSTELNFRAEIDCWGGAILLSKMVGHGNDTQGTLQNFLFSYAMFVTAKLHSETFQEYSPGANFYAKKLKLPA
jgi:hypothetical protein